MKTSRVVGPKAWRLIRALNAYDDFRGAVLDVVDEAAALSTTPAPLDVERLTRALHRVQSVADGHGDPTAPPDESCRIDAEAIAREYASAPPSKETPKP